MKFDLWNLRRKERHTKDIAEKYRPPETIGKPSEKQKIDDAAACFKPVETMLRHSAELLGSEGMPVFPGYAMLSGLAQNGLIRSGVEMRAKEMTRKWGEVVTAGEDEEKRAEAMNLSKGYYYGSEDPQTAYGLLIRKEDAEQIQAAADLADKVITFQNGSLQEQLVEEQLPECKNRQPVSSTNDGFLLVEAGRADAAAAHLKMAQLYLDSNPNSKLMILPDFYFSVDPNTQGTRIGIPKGEDELTERINEIIDEVLEQDLYNQWYEEYTEYAKNLGIDV